MSRAVAYRHAARESGRARRDENGHVHWTDETSFDDLCDVGSLTFALYFFGCPATGTEAGPLTFQLIPAAFAGRTFTTADVAALSAAYASAIAQSLSDAGAPPLTQAQATAVNNQLSFLAGRVPHLVTSSTFSASTCQ